MSYTLLERRKHARWTFVEPVQIRRLQGTAKFDQVAGIGKDLGMGGIMMQVHRFLAKSSKVMIQAVIPGTHEGLSGVARVAWCSKLPYTDDQYLVGLEFVQLSEVSQKLIQKYLQSQSK